MGSASPQCWPGRSVVTHISLHVWAHVQAGVPLCRPRHAAFFFIKYKFVSYSFHYYCSLLLRRNLFIACCSKHIIVHLYDNKRVIPYENCGSLLRGVGSQPAQRWRLGTRALASAAAFSWGEEWGGKQQSRPVGIYSSLGNPCVLPQASHLVLACVLNVQFCRRLVFVPACDPFWPQSTKALHPCSMHKGWLVSENEVL